MNTEFQREILADLIYYWTANQARLLRLLDKELVGGTRKQLAFTNRNLAYYHAELIRLNQSRTTSS